MKRKLLKSGKLVIVGAALISSHAMADGLYSSPTEQPSIQSIVETFDEALSLDISGGHREGSGLARVEADMNRLHKICAKIDASEEQRTAIRDEVFAFKEKTLPLETNLKLARLKYVQTALSATGLESDASARVTDAVNAVTAIAQAKGDLVTKILFQTLSPQQRKPALVCMAAMKLVHHHSDIDGHSID